MEEAAQHPRLVRFDSYLANLQSGELYRDGCRVKLPDQSFQLLAVLLERPGQVVMRREIQQRLWPDNTFVEFENSINAAIRRLRSALDDSAEQPRYIETIPRRGYRFVGTAVDTISPTSRPAPAANPPTGRSRRWLALGVAAVAFALLLTLGIARPLLKSDANDLPAIQVVPLLRTSGNEFQPAFSPDGNFVAFVLGEGEDSGIYAATIGQEKTSRLTQNPGDCCPTWSPDGRQIAFSRPSDWGSDIYAVSAFGGIEHRLLPWPRDTEHIASLPWRANSRSMDWSPDGKTLAFSQIQGDRTHARIALLNLADSAIHPISSPPGQKLDYGPTFSPDGSLVAFVRGSAAGAVDDLYLVPTTGREAKRLTFDNAIIIGPPAWTPDGRDLLFASTRGGLAALWRVSVSGGVPRPVPGAGVIAAFPAVSRKGHQLAYQQMSDKMNFVRLRLRDERHPNGPAPTVISLKGSNARPQFSPDGNRIVFESDRSGFSEIWTGDKDGANLTQMTSLHGVAGAARWSPDGHSIAFEFRPKEHGEIFIVNISSGVSHLLTTVPGADNGGPNWSKDGKWIYFYSDQGGGPFEVWKAPIEGGAPMQVTKHGGVFAAESPDGRFLYFVKLETAGIWSMALNGGEEKRILDRPAGENWWNWVVARNGIYFFDASTENRADVHSGINFMGSNAELKWGVYFYDFATEKTGLVTKVDKPSVGLAVSPDARSILYEQNEWANSSIVLVKNFR